MEALDNKCPTCGAGITFNPVTQSWDCKYCGSKFSLEEMEKCNSVNAPTNKEEQIDEGSENKMEAYHCKRCGAEILADETTTATFCVYCGSTAILKEKIETSKMPNFIIPFKNVKKDAEEAFKSLTKRKPLTPHCFKDPKNIDKITGIYIPFWAYDLEATGMVEFLGEDVKKWSDKEYHYTKTEKYNVEKSGKFEFKKVLADASTRFPNDLMDSLEPFDYTQLEEYNHAYLAGFLAEKYDVSEDEGLKRVQDRANNTAVYLMKETVKHDKVSVSNNQMSVVAKNIYYILLPVWMVNIKYKDRDYIFAMNGQTGKFIGNIPIGIKEAIIWGLLIFIVLFVVAFLGLKFI